MKNLAQENAKRTSNVIFFVYHTEETDHYKNCVLKFGIDGAEVVKGTGLLSSYRTCKFL